MSWLNVTMETANRGQAELLVGWVLGVDTGLNGPTVDADIGLSDAQLFGEIFKVILQMS